MSSIVKVDTIQENTSANGITVDGLNIKDSKLVTANSVVASNITADAIDATKIADNAISEEHLDVTAVTGHTAETSIADGDLVLIHDASASALRKMTKANFVSGIGGSNNIRFLASKASDQSISDGTTTKVTFDNEAYDVGSCFASNKVTVPANEGGTYLLYYNIRINAGAAGIVQYVQGAFYKNNAQLTRTEGLDYRDNKGGYSNNVVRTEILALDAGDYIEVYVDQSQSSGTPTVIGEGSGILMSTFGGFKLIT